MNKNPGSSPIAAESGDSFRALLEPLGKQFVQLEKFLSEEVATFEPEVQPLVKYCLGHSGKKLRPILVFLMSQGRNSQPNSIVRAAAIVELVHLATLVHDDILDGAELRHRTETVTAKYGSHAAVLLGDSLFARALELASEFPDTSVCKAVARSTKLVCSGEISQTFARGDSDLSITRYMRMIDLKTAELFAVSAWLGAHLSGASTSQSVAAERFARHLGIAYQIYDDAADIFADEGKAGKTLGTDLASGKFTLPILLYLEALDSAKREDEIAVMKNGQWDTSGLSLRLKEAGILNQVYQYFLSETASARGQISACGLADSAETLEQIVLFVESSWNKLSE